MKSSLLSMGCALALFSLLPGMFAAKIEERAPKSDDLDRHAFAALGAVADRKVSVEWNRYYDSEGLAAILARLHKAFPRLTRLYSVGKSAEGRDLWCLEVTAIDKGDAKRKPGMYIDGNIHGNEVQAGEVVAYTAWYLCHQYGHVEAVTELLDRCVFYLLPSTNPDGRDHFFRKPGSASWPRTGFKPVDDDRDGKADEDGYDDLDGDGSICQMRIRDPHGRWKKHPVYPELLLAPCEEDEPGEFTTVGLEGIDNDGDGLINEDLPGGYDMNRDWGWDWQPLYVQNGAMYYPFYLPETRALADFALSLPNLAAMQSYHNAMGAILRGPGRDGGNMLGPDEQVLQYMARRGETMLPFYRSLVTAKDLYTVWGGQKDWFYSARGVLSYTTELWTLKNLDRSTNAVTPETEAAFVKNVLLNEGAVKWHPARHPTYGEVEIGGFKKNWRRVPPSFLLEEECHRNMAFTLYHASQMPKLKFHGLQTTKLADELYAVRVTVENQRLIPTRIQQDVNAKISPPDILSLAGPQVRAISSGVVLDRYFNRVEPVKRNPARIEVDRIPGMGAVTVQFLVTGKGAFKVTLDSAKGGLFTETGSLPE